MKQSPEKPLTLSQPEHDKLTYVTRAVALLANRLDYVEESLAIKEASRFLANRRDLRVAMVTNNRLVKQLKAKTSLFENDSSYASLVVKRYDGNVKVFDLLNLEQLNPYFSEYA